MPTRPVTALFLALALAACTDNGDDSATDDTGGGDDTGAIGPDTDAADVLLRGVHMSPDLTTGCDVDGDTGTAADQFAACVSLFIGDGQIPLDETPFPFGASSAYLPVPVTGTYDLQAVSWNVWRANPYSANQPENRLVTFSADLLPGTAHTAVVFGANAVGNVGTVVVEEDLTPPTTGKARLRFFHGAFVAALATPDVAINLTPVAVDAVFGEFADAVELDPGVDQVVTVDTDGNGVPDLVALASLTADTIYDLFVVNVDPGTVPSGFLGLLHTSTSQEPVLVPFGPYTGGGGDTGDTGDTGTAR